MDTKEIRKDLGLTQVQFSERYNISLATVRNWDARNCMPTYLASIFAEIVSLRSQNEILQKVIDGDNETSFTY